MENKVFRYDQPTQVKFIDFDADGLFYQGGIAYGTEIICACCGCVFEIADIWADWKQYKNESRYVGIEKPIEAYKYWVPLREEILGDDAYIDYEQDAYEAQ